MKPGLDCMKRPWRFRIRLFFKKLFMTKSEREQLREAQKHINELYSNVVQNIELIGVPMFTVNQTPNELKKDAKE